jgi:retinol dehydrogenase 12
MTFFSCSSEAGITGEEVYRSAPALATAPWTAYMKAMTPDLSGRRVLITGATAGIGRQTALELAKAHAQVLVHGRDPAKVERVAAELRAQSGNPQVDGLVADLSSLRAVRELAQAVKQRYGSLNVLINNAGAVNLRRELTADGYERTFATNHLAPFLLTQLLLPELMKGAPARIINVSSDAHRNGQLDFDDLMGQRRYNPWIQYGRSKACNIYFTRELALRLEGKPIAVNALHPGFVASDFLSKGGKWRVLKPIAYLFAIDEAEGAKTSVWLASAPEVEGVSGKYFYRCRETRPRRFALDDAAAKRLWEESERLTGLTPSSQAA